MAAGADGFLTKPILSLDVFQTAILARMPSDVDAARTARAGRRNGASRPCRLARRSGPWRRNCCRPPPDDGRLSYVTQFLEQLAVQAGDFPLQHAADKLREARAVAGPTARIWRGWPGWCSSGWRAAAPVSTRAQSVQRRVARHQHRRGQRRQALPLPPLGVEIRRIQPDLERRLQPRPFAVDRREPGGVAVATLGHHRLPEQPLIGQPQPLGGPPRRQVQRVAFPFVAAIAQREDPRHHQQHRLGRRRGALQHRREVDVADLDGAIGRVDPQVAGDRRQPGPRPGRSPQRTSGRACRPSTDRPRRHNRPRWRRGHRAGSPRSHRPARFAAMQIGGMARRAAAPAAPAGRSSGLKSGRVGGAQPGTSRPRRASSSVTRPSFTPPQCRETAPRALRTLPQFCRVFPAGCNRGKREVHDDRD